MTIQSFFKTAGTVSLKTLRVLWGYVGALVAVIAYVMGEAFKHASAADAGAKSGADVLLDASRYESTDWIARNYDLD